MEATCGEINCGFAWSTVGEVRFRTFITVSIVSVFFVLFPSMKRMYLSERLLLHHCQPELFIITYKMLLYF